MSDQTNGSSADSQMERSFAHGIAREVAVQAAVNMLLDQHAPTGKTHVDIFPSAGDTVGMLTQREGGPTKIDHFALANLSRKEDSTVFDVIQGTGHGIRKPQAREIKADDGTTVVQAAGLGRVEGVTRMTLMPAATLLETFNATGDETQVWGKRCVPEQICSTAILDHTGKVALGVVKIDLLKDSPNSRLTRMDVYKFEPDKSQTKVGDFYLLERHEPNGRTALDINSRRNK